MADYSELMKLEKKKPLPPTQPTNVAIPETEGQVTNLPANQQTSKEVNQQTNKLANQQTSKEGKKQTSLPANQQTSKILKKFGSYLTEESIKRLKRIAFETDRKDYEVLQEAVDAYLQRVKE